jgi:hypothetical protein
MHTLLRAAQSALSLAHLITRAHEYLAKALFLPRWEYQYARQIVVVPAHLLLAEEAHHLFLLTYSIFAQAGNRNIRCRIVRDEQVVEEGRDIVEDGFGVEEQLREEAEVLSVELVLLAIDFVD